MYCSSMVTEASRGVSGLRATLRLTAACRSPEQPLRSAIAIAMTNATVPPMVSRAVTFVLVLARPGRATVAWLAALIPCLLYTSDAADERSSVDLGGRRI